MYVLTEIEIVVTIERGIYTMYLLESSRCDTYNIFCIRWRKFSKIDCVRAFYNGIYLGFGLRALSTYGAESFRDLI
jgi:hypothetical protein